MPLNSVPGADPVGELENVFKPLSVLAPLRVRFWASVLLTDIVPEDHCEMPVEAELFAPVPP